MTRSIRAFSLMELMVATAIMVTLVVGLLFTYVYCVLLNESNQNLVIANNDAQYVLEQIKCVVYDNLPAYAAPVFSNLSDEDVVVTATPGSRLTEVTVEVHWVERSRPRSYSLTTRIHC